VPSLSSPDLQHPIQVDSLTQYESIGLFLDRAATALPGFTVTNDNAQGVAQVCHRLDGIPLAIELAAARVKLLRVEQIAERLDDRFNLLTSGGRTALPRHQTLAALIDWSHDLLTESERSLLRRLSVFAGGWTLEAAEAVCAGDEIESAKSLDLLTQLVNKSLILVERRQGEEARYRMLETIRQYALEKLTSSSEADALRQRHAEYYLALAKEGESFTALVEPAQLDRMEAEHDNLRAALAWSESAIGSAELGLRLAGALSVFWYYRAYWSEAHGWLEGALAHPEAANYPQARAWVLYELGSMAAAQSDYTTMQAQLTESLIVAQDLGDPRLRALVLNGIGLLARERGDTITARLRLEECLGLFRELEDKEGIAMVLVTLGEVAVMQEDIKWATALLEEGLVLNRRVKNIAYIGWALNHLGHVAQLESEYKHATQLHGESLPLFRELGADTGIAHALQSLGETALAQGNAALAATHLTEALALFHDVGDRAGTSWCLAGLAGVAALNEEPERAAWLWGAAEALRQSIGARPAPAARATHERLQGEVRKQLGEAAFNAKWAEGQAA
jgi:non-specific serine/threonine protein kinase